jgi:uncharacterized protein (DUF2252 family)
MNSIVERIEQFNRGRESDRLRLKYQKMRGDRFAFFRGTCHLFYEDLRRQSGLDDAPLVWISGDLHLENFGSYKGDDRQVYFDVNDFDEAVLAPCTWEMVRFITSIFVAAKPLQVDPGDAEAIAKDALSHYTQALASGKARDIATDTSAGMIGDLLQALKQRKRETFLDRYTEVQGRERRFHWESGRTERMTKQERVHLEEWFETWAKQQPDAEFYRLLDVAQRIAGVSSLGLRRYLLLVEGKGSPDRNLLLDLKQSRPSALMPALAIAQPHWNDESSRIVAIQTRVQAVPPALLQALSFQGESYVLRELQPTQDKLSLGRWNHKLDRLRQVVQRMGAIAAWGQLRSGGRDRSAIADELIDFAASSQWQEPLMAYAQRYTDQVEADYQEFCAGTADLEE